MLSSTWYLLVRIVYTPSMYVLLHINSFKQGKLAIASRCMAWHGIVDLGLDLSHVPACALSPRRLAV
jgi:hypothetical protein